MQEIIDDIFDISETKIDKVKYIKYYSKIYSIINMLNSEDYASFELNIKKYIKQNLLKCDINIINYFEQFNKFNEKVENGSKLFIYYNNENNILIKMFLEAWEEIVISNIFPKILEIFESNHNIKVVNYNETILFNKINSYYYHLFYINKNLGEIFKNIILKLLNNNIQKNNLEDINTIMIYINNFEKLSNIFYNDDESKKNILKNVNNIISNNISKIYNYFIDLISNIYQNKNKINESKRLVDIIKKYSDDKYCDNIVYLFKNFYKKESYSNIDNLFKYMVDIKNLYNTIFSKNINYSKTINYHLNYSISSFATHEEYISYVKNISKNNINEINKFLEFLIEDLQDNFDEKFNIELIKYLNKFIHNKSVIENINAIINLLKDKESFVVYYKNGLKKRLLNDNVYLENEKYLINVFMKNENLLDVSRMDVMLNDFQKSIIINNEYNSLFNNSNNVLLTTYDMWNFKQSSYNDKFNSTSFKNELELMENNFKTYYKTNNGTKNVEFVHNISKCIISFNNIDLVCNYLQADLLYMFNDTNSINLNEINIDKELLYSLTKPKILIKKGKIVKVNSNFKYKKPSLELYKLYNQTVKTINKGIKKDLNKIIFEKKEIIDCALVNFLKKNQNKIINFDILLKITNDKLSKKFTIDKELLIERLSYLIDKEYIKILTNDLDQPTNHFNLSTNDLTNKTFKYIH